jgi:hypothetical protein
MISVLRPEAKLFGLRCLMIIGTEGTVLAGISTLLIVIGSGLTVVLPIAALYAAGFSFDVLVDPMFYAAGVLACCAAATVDMMLAVRRRYGSDNLAAGASGFWTVVAILATAFLPSSSYLFVLPSIGCVTSLAVVVWLQPSGRAQLTRGLLTILILPTVILWTPVLYILPIAFNLFAGAVLAVALSLVLTTAVPQLLLLTGTRSPLLPVGRTGLLLAVATALLFLWSGHDQPQPGHDTLLYAGDLDAGSARWVSFDRAPDAWTRQYLTNTPKHDALEGFLPNDMAGLVATAPLLDLAAPTVVSRERADLASDDSAARTDGTPVSRANVSDGRTLHLVAKSAQAAAFFLTIEAADPITALAVDGQVIPVTASDRSWQAMFYGAPDQGFAITVELAGRSSVRLTMVDQILQLPQIPGKIHASRRGSVIPKPFIQTDLTLVKKSFIF